MTTAKASAQIALGKFYLHRWEVQVLVDWATSMLEHGYDSDAMQTLASMEGMGRATQLDQFLRTCREEDIQVREHLELSVRAYIEDLRRRALAGEIDLKAAFAQLRPLAYDSNSVRILGLEELDEDLNLLDSYQPRYHYPELTADNKEEYLRRFFERMEIMNDSWQAAGRPPREIDTDMPPQPEADFARYVEMTAIIAITLVFVIYVLLLLVSFLAV